MATTNPNEIRMNSDDFEEMKEGVALLLQDLDDKENLKSTLEEILARLDVISIHNKHPDVYKKMPYTGPKAEVIVELDEGPRYKCK